MVVYSPDLVLPQCDEVVMCKRIQPVTTALVLTNDQLPVPLCISIKGPHTMRGNRFQIAIILLSVTVVSIMVIWLNISSYVYVSQKTWYLFAITIASDAIWV